MESVDRDITPEIAAAQAEQVRSKPKAIQDLMRKFPPACRVLASGYAVPGAGLVGIVVSYFDDGHVGVVHEDPAMNFLFGTVRGECETSRLTVVGYTLPFTPEWVEEVLK